MNRKEIQELREVHWDLLTKCNPESEAVLECAVDEFGVDAVDGTIRGFMEHIRKVLENSVSAQNPYEKGYYDALNGILVDLRNKIGVIKVINK